MANSAFTHEPSFTIPGSTTDNAVIRWDGTSGTGQLNSGIIINDSNVITGVTSLTVDNLLIDGNTISSTAGTDLFITPLSGQQLILDGTIIIDAGVVTAATSITSTQFVGGGVGLTALVAGNITSGGTFLAQNGSALTALNGSAITSGTLPAARIAADSIVEAKLDVSNGPTNGQFLQAQSGEGGGLTWAAAGSTDISVRVRHSSNQGIAHATWSTLAFNTEIFDTDTMHDNSTNNSRLTCKTAGLYYIWGNAAFATNSTGERYLAIGLNGASYGTDIAQIANGNHDGETRLVLHITTVFNLSVDDYVELRLYHSANTTLNIEAVSPHSPIFGMVKLV